MLIQTCTQDQLKKIYESLNTTEENMQRDVKILEDWIEQQPHLPKFKGQWVSKLFLGVTFFTDIPHASSFYTYYLQKSAHKY